jgi:hypothetical protein
VERYRNGAVSGYAEKSTFHAEAASSEETIARVAGERLSV